MKWDLSHLRIDQLSHLNTKNNSETEIKFNCCHANIISSWSNRTLVFILHSTFKIELQKLKFTPTFFNTKYDSITFIMEIS